MANTFHHSQSHTADSVTHPSGSISSAYGEAPARASTRSDRFALRSQIQRGVSRADQINATGFLFHPVHTAWWVHVRFFPRDISTVRIVDLSRQIFRSVAGHLMHR